MVFSLSIGLSIGSSPIPSSSEIWDQDQQPLQTPLLFLEAVSPVYAIAPPSPSSDSLPTSPSQPQSAQMLFNAGVEHFQAQRFQEAIDHWKLALDTYNHSADTLQAALVSSNLSLAYQHLGEWQNAEESLNASLLVFDPPPSDASSNKEWGYFAKALNAQGWFHWRRGNPQEAYQSWQEADRAYSAIPYISGVIGSRINQAKALQSLGLNVAAKETLEGIRTFIEALSKKKATNEASTQEELMLERLIPESPILGSLNQDDLINTERIRFDVQVIAYQALGNALRRVGELEEAAVVLEMSGAIANQHFSDFPSPDHYRASKSSILLDLANTERDLWERAVALNLDLKDDIIPYRNSALEHCRQSLENASTALARAKAQANLLRLLTDIWQEDPSSKLPWTSELGTEIKELWHKLHLEFADLPLGRSSLDVQFNSVETILNLQAHHAKTEPPEKVLFESQAIQPELKDILFSAYSQAQQLGDQRAESIALGQLGHLYEQAERWGEAKVETEKAIALADPIQALDIQYRWEWQLARILNQSEPSQTAQCYRDDKDIEPSEENVREPLYNDAVLCTYDLAVTHLEQVRQDLLYVDSDVQFSFRDNVEPLYRQYVDVLLTEDETLKQSTGTSNQAYLKRATQLIDSLQLAELENYLGCNLDPVQLTDKVLDPTAAIFYPILLSDRLEVILQMPNNIFSRSRSLHSDDERELSAVIQQLLMDLQRPKKRRAIEAGSHLIYEKIIRPFENEIAAEVSVKSKVEVSASIKTLVFVSDGPLRSVPMSVLWDGEHYLLEKYAIAVAPSLQLIESKKLERPLKVLATGSSQTLKDPEGRELQRLPNVEKEIRDVETLVDADVLLNEEFNRKNLEQQLKENDYSIVHVASHGVFSADPNKTYIALPDPFSDGSQKHVIRADELDILLRSRDIDDSIIQLLVLSACQTASGDDRATLGLAGLSVQAGARSTIAALWSVQDESTAALISEFYKQLKYNPSMSRAEALRQAQLYLRDADAGQLENWDRPLYWAPYVIVGNWL